MAGENLFCLAAGEAEGAQDPHGGSTPPKRGALTMPKRVFSLCGNRE